MKYLILVGDGMGDHPVTELDGKTPLEAANTPTIDRLCQNGELFLTKTVPDGMPPGSDVANLSLLGYDPEKYYTGRAPLEAASMGIELAPDETAFRCNMVTLEYNNDGTVTMVDFAAGHITSDESHQLIAALEETCQNDKFSFKPGISYRNLMVLKGDYPQLDPVPPHDHIGKDVTEYWQRYQNDPVWKEMLDTVGKTLESHPVNETRKANGKLPANMVWLWGEGKMPDPPTLKSRFDITGTMVSAVDLLKGLGVVGGLEVAEVEGATGYIDTNYEGKAQAALSGLNNQDFAFVHLEGPDEAGHQGSLADKLQAIEDFDEKIVKRITEELAKQGEDYRVVVTMDHFTPLELRTHTSEPVPTLLYDSRGGEKSGKTLCEKDGREQEKQFSSMLSSGYTLINKLLERN